jgi:hypothetical protein
MEMIQPVMKCEWLVMEPGMAAVESELTALGVPFVRIQTTYVWPGGQAPAARYEFSFGAQVGILSAAVHRITGAGLWFSGSHHQVTPLSP